MPEVYPVPYTSEEVLPIPDSGNGSVTLETPTGDVDGVNDEFVFSAPPILVFRNGVMLLPAEVTIVGTTATLTTPPPNGIIQGLIQ